MKYIKIQCDKYDCEAKFLIAMDNWYIKEYGNVIHEWYICPICEGIAHTKEGCIIELP